MSNFALKFNKPPLSEIFRVHNRTITDPDQIIDWLSGEEVRVFNPGRNKEEGYSHPLASIGLRRNESLAEHAFDEIDFAQQGKMLRESAAGLLPAKHFLVREWTTVHPLAIGLGTPSFYENGIQLHHIYGFPYLPASSIKGAMRHWTIYRYFDNREEKAVRDPFFRYLFGYNAEEDNKSQGGRAQVIYWDAFPQPPADQQAFLKVDILNTHFSEYYGGKEAPTDTQDPIPVYFLTVKKNTPFQFILGIRKRPKPKGFVQNYPELAAAIIGKKPSLLYIAEYLLRETLQHWGIGAKTALGYGRLQAPQNNAT